MGIKSYLNTPLIRLNANTPFMGPFCETLETLNNLPDLLDEIQDLAQEGVL